jgi:GxxExxY protein
VTERLEAHLLHHDLTRVIIGAGYAVHTELGCGFLESVYANAIAVLLRHAGYRVEREAPFEIVFHGENIGRYRADLIVESQIVVEVKCGRAIDPTHKAQVLNYLRATGLGVGLLLNFGRSMECRRLISSAGVSRINPS